MTQTFFMSVPPLGALITVEPISCWFVGFMVGFSMCPLVVLMLIGVWMWRRRPDAFQES